MTASGMSGGGERIGDGVCAGLWKVDEVARIYK